MLYYGTIQNVYPPTSEYNLNKYQYEYSVVISGDLQCQIPLNNVTFPPFFIFSTV